MGCGVQNSTSEFVTFVPVAEDKENATQKASAKNQGEADNGGARSAAQLFLSLWLAMKEGNLLAVGTYKGLAAWAPKPVGTGGSTGAVRFRRRAGKSALLCGALCVALLPSLR